MAEVAAVIGLVASIASLVDLSVKIVSRVKDYAGRAVDVPQALRSLVDRLPLLTQTLTRIQARAQAGHVTTDAAQELDILVRSVLEQVRLVEQYLDDLVPASSATRFDRALIGLKTVAKDQKVKQAVEKIHRGIDVLVLHQTTTVTEVSDHILQELNQLKIRIPPSQQPIFDRVEQQAFGMCLGRAPLIDPDAFIGRKAELQQLHQWLSPSQHPRMQRVVSIVGMGGLGKTQLSLAYAREYGHQYSSVFWLNAQDIACLRQDMSALAAILFSGQEIAAAAGTSTNVDGKTVEVETVRRWLSMAPNSQWLLIFDNYDDPSLPHLTSPTGFDIREFFPTRAHGSILITTRSSKLAFSKPLYLQKLHDVEICTAVLAQRSRRDLTEDPDHRRLVVRLDGLPLALAVAGTYLAQAAVSCAEYLDLYEMAWSELHGPDTEALMEYANRNLSSTWTVSLNQVRQQDADAAELLSFLGYLHCDDIWYELIQAGADVGPQWISRVTTSKIQFNRTMSKLVNYSLVEVRNGSYRVHPCLHDWIFEHLNTHLDGPMFVTLLICLGKSISDIIHQHSWKVNRRFLNHVRRTQHPKFTAFWDSHVSDSRVSYASYYFGLLCDDLCELSIAEQMYMRALAGRDKVFGADHSLTLNVANSLGILYRTQGKLTESEQMYVRALAGYEKTFGPDCSSTLSIINNLGILYRTQGKLVESEQMHVRALTGYNKALRPDYNSIFGTINNLGVLYCNQGRLVDAEEMYRRALAGRKEILGLHHGSTLDTINNLYILYGHQGKLAEVDKLYRRILEACQNAHSTSAQSRSVAYGMAVILNRSLRISGSYVVTTQAFLVRLVHHAEQWARGDKQVINLLAKALTYVEEDEDASIAYFHSLVSQKGMEDFESIVCDDCKNKITIAQGRHVCRQCDDIDLCHDCMAKYTHGDIALTTCHGHEYFDAGSAVTTILHRQAVEGHVENKTDMWLTQLRDKYQVHVQ